MSVRRGGPGITHEKRRAVLESIAMLSGYSTECSGSLPDGTRPDVLRVDPSCGSVFIGEAKDTESPGCRETCDRLGRYLDWFRALVVTGCKASMLAVCFGESRHVEIWPETLSRLAREAGVGRFLVGCRGIDGETFVAWLRVPK